MNDYDTQRNAQAYARYWCDKVWNHTLPRTRREIFMAWIKTRWIKTPYPLYPVLKWRNLTVRVTPQPDGTFIANVFADDVHWRYGSEKYTDLDQLKTHIEDLLYHVSQ